MNLSELFIQGFIDDGTIQKITIKNTHENIINSDQLSKKNLKLNLVKCMFISDDICHEMRSVIGEVLLTITEAEYLGWFLLKRYGGYDY